MTGVLLRGAFVLVLGLAPLRAQAGVNQWTAHGPDGGFVRGIGVDPADPDILYAGLYGGVWKSADAGGTWTHLPQEGDVRAFVVDPIVSGTAYAGLYGGGVRRTMDGGTTWSSPSSGGPSTVVSLALDPSTTTTLYAGTEGAGGGVFKSLDGGASWSLVSTGLPDPSIYALAVDSHAPAVVYAGVGEIGLFRSADGGTTWTPTSVTGWVQSILVDPTQTGVVYAGSGGTLHKSVDDGATWVVASNPLPGEILGIAHDPSSPDTVYVDCVGGLFQTVDGGGSWSALPVGNIAGGPVVVDPVSPSRLYVGTRGAGMARSLDGGATWLSASRGLPGQTAVAVAVDATMPNVAYAAAEHGIYRTTDTGDTWIDVSEAWGDRFVRAVAAAPSVSSVVYAGVENVGVVRSSDAGAHWTTPGVGSPTRPRAIAVSPADPATAVAWGNFTARTTDGGATWSATPGIDDEVSALAFAPSDPAIVYAAARGIFRSSDGGITWQNVSGDLPSGYYYALAIDPVSSNLVYVGSLDFGGFKTTDGGMHWNPMHGGQLRALAVDSTAPDIVYASSSSNTLERSLDGGVTWSPMSNGLTAGPPFGLALDSTGTTLYAGTDRGGVAVFEIQPGCGNGYLDLGEQCDDGNTTSGDCCSSACQPEDVDLDGYCDALDNCPLLPNAEQFDSDGDHVGDACDPCPSDATDMCNGSQSGAQTIDSGGGSVPAADGSIVVSVPPGALANPTSISITGGLPSSNFAITDTTQAVVLAKLGPSGTAFASPVTVVLSWTDAGDGTVAGTNPPIGESDLQVWKDGEPLTGPCGSPNHQPPLCSSLCCDMALNQWSVQVTSFSEFLLGRQSCAAQPLAGCRRPVKPLKASLSVRNLLLDDKDQIIWKWTAGAATTSADLGVPTQTDGYALCLYDGSTLIFQGSHTPGGNCGKNGCWSLRGRSSIHLGDRTGFSEGITSIDLKPGDAGKAKITVQGKGTRLSNRPNGLPSTPLPLPVRVQLQSQAGSCWEATFTAAGTSKNQAGVFASKGD